MIRKGLLFSAPILAVICAIAIYGWIKIEPGQLVPSHFNIEGEADRLMPKEQLLVMFLALPALLTAMFAFLPQIMPRRANLDKSGGLYLSAWIGVLLVLAASEFTLVRTAVTGASPSVAFITVPVALLIIVVGNFMAKTRSNWLAGVRTPWTMSSEHAWKAANRTSGWLFVLVGAASLLTTGFIDAKLGVQVLVAGVVVSGVAGVVASYFAWRNDPVAQGADVDR